jgi:hypothetical protein
MGTARGYDRLRRTVKKKNFFFLYINFTTPSQISIDVLFDLSRDKR